MTVQPLSLSAFFMRLDASWIQDSGGTVLYRMKAYTGLRFRNVSNESCGQHRDANMELSTYRFSAPILVRHKELELVDVSHWQSGEAWLTFLIQNKNDLSGIVLPLELKSGVHSMQESHGVELLHWLRWSAEEPLAHVPVLAVSFQSAEAILRRTLNLLLVAKGTSFMRLPDALERIGSFVRDVREGRESNLWADAEELDRVAAFSGESAQQITYHDLANDYYCASRLWAGYLAALRAATADAKRSTKKAMTAECDRTGAVEFSWEKAKIKPLLMRPDVRLYSRLSKRRSSAPIYPATPNANQVVLNHVVRGLPPTTRLLLVDDDFDKGLADTLLQILFKQAEFSKKSVTNDEWVYSERFSKNGVWARFVCVRNAELATRWLTYWAELDDDDGFDRTQGAANQAWLSRWAETLDTKWSDKEDSYHRDSDILADTVDNPLARPQQISTVVLLDLWLNSEEQKDAYDPLQLKSVQLRKLIKRQDNPAPIIMMTASRQAMAYAAVMGDAGQADGWLSKEGPDIHPSDSNSACAVHYLLERLHLFALVHDWYREDLKWDAAVKIEHSRLRNHPDWPEKEREIGACATNLFAKLRESAFQEQHKSSGSLGWADASVASYTPHERTLVLRRVIVGALLESADWKEGEPTWNNERFNNLIPGRHSVDRYKKKPRAEGSPSPYHVVNFKHLWLKTKPAQLSVLLLREEYDWLEKVLSKQGPSHSFVVRKRREAHPMTLTSS